MPTTTLTPDSDPKKLFAELSARGIDAEEYTRIKTIIEEAPIKDQLSLRIIMATS